MNWQEETDEQIRLHGVMVVETEGEEETGELKDERQAREFRKMEKAASQRNRSGRNKGGGETWRGKGGIGWGWVE